MPTTIPYDPSLVLGNIADPDKIAVLETVGTLQAAIDVEQDALNNLIEQKRSLDQTLQEMINMNVNSDDLKGLAKSIDDTQKAMATQASKYAGVVVAQTPKITAERQKIGSIVEANVESPIDWNKSALKPMDIAADTFNVNAQYIRNESEQDGTSAHASSVAVAASSSLSTIFGPKISGKVAGQVQQSTLEQTNQHNIEGTILITAVATHKTANMFAPFILDPEKGIRAWNSLIKAGKAGKGAVAIDTTDDKSLAAAMADEDTIGMQLLSGATFGSSFVGMVHLVQVESSESSQSASAKAASVEVDWQVSAWFAKKSGSFGTDASFSNNIKNLMSRSDIQAHCSLVTMGIIPSLKSNTIKSSIKTLQPDAKDVMGQLAAIQGSNDTAVNNMSAAANQARGGKEFMQLNNSYVSAVVSNLGEIDNNNNKVIDMNSLMTAFDDYVERANSSIMGVPINYYLKPITPNQLANAWLTKFDPLKDWTGSSTGDDAQGDKT